MQSTNEYKGKLSEHTITVRLYGMDAPEVGKNGNPSMPFATEAKEYTLNKVGNQIVNVKLLRKDQYSRVVGKVINTSSRECTQAAAATAAASYECDLSLGLIHNGYGTMYKGKGAEYDEKKNDFEKEVEYAQRQKKGIWYNGVENVQTPAEYKRAIKGKQAATAALQ